MYRWRYWRVLVFGFKNGKHLFDAMFCVSGSKLEVEREVNEDFEIGHGFIRGIEQKIRA